MKYRAFKSSVRNYPVVTATLLNLLGEHPRVLRNQLSRWQRRGLVVQLRRGLYVLNKEDRGLQPSPFFLANQLVFPSYVSLESALAYHYMIPETVYQVTSVTTRKPALFDTPEGVFRYRHVKSTLYFGFEPLKDDNGLTVQMATPEKALLDFFYLNQSKFSATDRSIFEASYRLQPTEALRADRLREFATRFGSRKLERLVELFIEVFPGKLLHA